MKKTLLTSIAALFLATGTAHADQPNIQLPDYVLGYWCYDQASSPNNGEEHYYDQEHDCDEWFTDISKDDDGNYGFFTDLILNGLKEPRADYCLFDKIEPVDVPAAAEDNRVIFLIHAKCESFNGVDPPWEERFELSWGEGRLIIQSLPDS